VGPRAWCDGEAAHTRVQSSTMARMRRADVDPGVEDMRTMDSSDITKSAQEPDCGPNTDVVCEPIAHCLRAATPSGDMMVTCTDLIVADQSRSA
jgi:hypothetical protein